MENTKTIQLSIEDYDFLMETKNNLLTQDNRSTRDPIYIIRTSKKIYGFDDEYSNGYDWVSDDGDSDFDPNDVDLIVKRFEEWYDIKVDKDLFLNNDDGFGDDGCETYEDYIMESQDYRKINYQDITYTIEEGTYFLTEQRALEHLSINKHKYPEGAYVYADSSWRNYEINRLRDIISKIE